MEDSQFECGRAVVACVRAYTGFALLRESDRPPAPGGVRDGGIEMPPLGRAITVAVGHLEGLGSRCMGEGSPDRGVAAAPHQRLRRTRGSHPIR